VRANISAMNGTTEPTSERAVVIRVELTCFYCGHSCGEARVHTTGRPSYRDVRAAFAEQPASTAPEWDAHGAPRCPRCRGKLFIAAS
jgi:hypothetical protein